MLFLMFGVGLHVSFDDLSEVRSIAVPGAAIQIVISAALGCWMTQSWGWNASASLIFGVAIGKAALFVALMLIVGKRLIPWLLQHIVGLQSRELFIVVSLTIAIGTALLSAARFGVSLALGAFLAWVVVGESRYHHQVGADLLPFRDPFRCCSSSRSGCW